MGRRVLITGLGSFWGGRVAMAMEADPSVEVIVGVDTHEPTHRLERTEFVRADQNYSILSRIVDAAQIETILHTFLQVDSTATSGRALHETNVIGTMNLLAACSSANTSVRHVVVKSSTMVYGASSQDPVWFRENMRRRTTPKTRVERSLVEVEGYLRDYAEDNPHVNVTLLRFSNVLGTDVTTPISRLLQLPMVPAIAGFDPRLQFVHEDDVVRSLTFVVDNELGGVFNVAGDGLLPWSEVAALCGKRLLHIPFLGADWLAAALRGLRVFDIPEETEAVLRYGRGVDNRRLKQAGFRYHYTSAGAVDAFSQADRLNRSVGTRHPGYKYEQDVENFFRHSPAVVRHNDLASRPPTS